MRRPLLLAARPYGEPPSWLRHWDNGRLARCGRAGSATVGAPASLAPVARTGDRGVVITILSLPTPPPRRFWKRFAHGKALPKTRWPQARQKFLTNPLART